MICKIYVEFKLGNSIGAISPSFIIIECATLMAVGTLERRKKRLKKNFFFRNGPALYPPAPLLRTFFPAFHMAKRQKKNYKVVT